MGGPLPLYSDLWDKKMIAIKRLFFCVLGLAMLLFPGAMLSACEAQSTKQGAGTVVGAILGGVLGHQIGSGSGQTAATIGGVILGGVAGNAIGKHMDEEDCRRMAQALNNNAAGQSSSWTNTTSGASYTVT